MLASTQYSHNILSTFTIFIYIHLKQPVKAEGVAVEWLDRGVATTKKSHILGTTKNLKASFERCRDLISGGACSGRTEEKKNIYIYRYTSGKSHQRPRCCQALGRRQIGKR